MATMMNGPENPGQGPPPEGIFPNGPPQSHVAEQSTPTMPEMTQMGQVTQGPMGDNLPPFFGYLRWFDSMKPPADLRAAAAKLIDNLDAVWQQNGAYHPAAQSYDRGQFLHDVAVVAAAQHSTEVKPAPKTQVKGPQ